MTAYALVRPWLVRWLYLVGVAHLFGACAMTWLSDSPLFVSYHQQVLESAGFAMDDSFASEFQQWWVSLFGATLQAFAFFLLMLVYCGDRQRSRVIWSFMAIVLLWWAPQDIYISLQKNMWTHVWVDLVALVVLVPPLMILAFIDKRKSK